MGFYFLDSSALVKHYINEVDTSWVRSICASNPIAISSLATVELSSALVRRIHEGTLTPPQRDHIMRTYLVQASGFVMVELTNPTIESAARLIRRYPVHLSLRSLDAIQLVCARIAFDDALQRGVSVDAFVSADQRLLSAARWAGFVTENPEHHT